MPGQSEELAKGGTMRLGNYTTKVVSGTTLEKVYASCPHRLVEGVLVERHRHRFEVNPTYVAQLEKAGMTISGVDEKTGLVEFIEYTDHPYFIATQAHPEFTSRLEDPHPLFVGLIVASRLR